MASNNRSPSILQNVHSPTAQSLKVVAKGMDASNNTPAILTEADGTVNVKVTSGSVTVGDGTGDLTVDGTVAVSSVAGTVTVTGDAGGSLTVDGTVAVSNFPATQAVTISSGSVTISDGDGPLTVDGTVEVGGTPAEEAEYVHASTAAASIPSDWGTFIAAQSDGIRVMHIFNTTEQPLAFSFNTSEGVHYVVPAHSTLVIDYKGNELKEVTALSYKYVTEPTTGTVYGTVIA